MTSKKITSGELLSTLNKNIDKSHHNKAQSVPENQTKKQQKVQPIIQQKQTQHIQPEKPIKVQQKPSKKKTQVKENKQKQKVENETKDKKKQTQQSQSKSQRTNITRVSDILNKKDNFKQNFENGAHEVQQEQLGQTLHQILAMQIGKLITEPLAEVIESSLKQKQNLVYIAFTQSNLNYFENLLQSYKKRQDNNISEIEQLLNKREDKTLQKLNNLQLFIDRERSINTKGQLQQLSKMDAARLLKIKEGSIKSKVQLLNHKMFEFQQLQAAARARPLNFERYQQQKLQQLTDPNNFSLSSQKTKIANDYVKHLHHQKLVLLKRMRQREQKRSQIQKQRQISFKQAQQMRNAVKKQEVQTRIVQHQKKRQQQSKQIEQKTKKVQQFLKEYRKSLPLYKKKEKQFKNVYIKSKEKEIQQKLKDIRQNRRSLSMNQIREHQQKYSQRRSLQQSKRQEQFKMMLKARQASQASKQYFKGFFHDKTKVLDQQQRLKFYSMREQTRKKIQRMTQFGQKIKKFHKPKIDVKKKQDLQSIIQLQQLKKKKVKKLFKQVQGQNGQVKLQAYYEQIPTVDHYKQGNKFMEISKSLAKKKSIQQTSRYSQKPEIQLSQNNESRVEQKKPLTTWDTPSSIITQQKDIWKLRGKQLHQMTEDINPNNFYQIKKNLQLIDQRAKMKEELLKHKQVDAHQILQQKNILDEFYLESIKNKIKLLNQ